VCRVVVELLCCGDSGCGDGEDEDDDVDERTSNSSGQCCSDRSSEYASMGEEEQKNRSKVECCSCADLGIALALFDILLALCRWRCGFSSHYV